jgi:hypothetical protein
MSAAHPGNLKYFYLLAGGSKLLGLKGLLVYIIVVFLKPSKNPPPFHRCKAVPIKVPTTLPHLNTFSRDAFRPNS